MQILLNTIMLEPRRWSVPKSVTIPLIKLLPRIKEQGFDELEIWGYHLWNMSEDELSFLLKKLEEKNMKASSVGSYLTSQGGPERKGILDAARRYLSICKRLKSKRLRVFYGDRDLEKSDHIYLRFIDEVFEEILKMAQDEGVVVMAEMHTKTLVGSIQGLRRAIEKWGSYPNFGLVYQPYEFNTESALEALDVAIRYMKSVHLQNRHNGQFTGLAQGDVDYRKVLEKLASFGYDGPFVLEFTEGIAAPLKDFDCRRILSSAAKDREWLKSTWRKLNG